MTNYRDRLAEDYGMEIGSVVGCGLDRLARPVDSYEIHRAMDYFELNKALLSAMPIGARREKIADLFR